MSPSKDALTGRANICQVTTRCDCDVPGTVLQKASGIFAPNRFPLSLSHCAPWLTMTVKLAACLHETGYYT